MGGGGAAARGRGRAVGGREQGIFIEGCCWSQVAAGVCLYVLKGEQCLYIRRRGWRRYYHTPFVFPSVSEAGLFWHVCWCRHCLSSIHSREFFFHSHRRYTFGFHAVLLATH